MITLITDDYFVHTVYSTCTSAYIANVRCERFYKRVEPKVTNKHTTIIFGSHK